MIGIYKITNPIGQVYIGQSRNVEKRLKSYNLDSTRGQKKLYTSFLEFGIDNHTFELIEECEVKDLSKRERFYQIFYNSVSNGLNVQLASGNESKENINSGRKTLPDNEKKQLVRVFEKKETIDLIGEEKLKIEISKLINHLQSQSLKKCADEVLKQK